jgi:Leucine-rich repeat (LRR) protein
MSFSNTVTQHGDLLVLNGGYHPPIDFAAAIAGRTFKRLHIYGKPKNLKLLSTLTQLVELRMQSTKLTDFSLLAGMNRLEVLIYGSGSLKECDLSFASKSLTSLWLTDHRSLMDLTSISNCTKLKELSLRNLSHVKSYIDLKSLPHLELLALRNLRQWPSISGIAGAKSLQKLFLDRTKIEDAVWEPLLKLKRLKYVSALEDAFGDEIAAEFRIRRPEVEAPRRFPG